MVERNTSCEVQHTLLNGKVGKKLLKSLLLIFSHSVLIYLQCFKHFVCRCDEKSGKNLCEVNNILYTIARKYLLCNLIKTESFHERFNFRCLPINFWFYIISFAIIILKGYCTSYQILACFVLYHKISTTFWKMNYVSYKKLFKELKMALKF